MVEVKKGTYINDTEVTIGEWFQFIFYALNEQDSVVTTKINNELLPQKHIIEKLDYRDIFDFSQGTGILSSKKGWTIIKEIPIPNKILKSLNKDSIISIINRPITGLSINQTTAYCKYIEFLQSKLFKTEYQCSMPSIDLIEYIFKNERRTDTEFLNGRKPAKQKKAIEYGDKIQIVAFGYPDNFGIYDLWTNADEIIDEQETKLIGRDINVLLDNYSGPEIKLGFRCSCKKVD